MTAPVKTAVVGVGALGKHHLRWLSQIDSSQLVGCFDTDRSRAEEFAAQYDVAAFTSLDGLAAACDAAVIATPTSTHHEVATQLLNAGVNCLIEKPIAATYDEAVALQQLAADRGLTVTVGQIERFNPAVRQIKQLELEPAFIEAHRLAAFDPRASDVAVILDLMIHDIDLSLHLIGSPVVDIQAAAVKVVSKHPDIANCRLTFANGAVANLTASRISLQPMRKMRIFQPAAYLSLDLGAKTADLYQLVSDDAPREGMRLPLGKSGQEIAYHKLADSGDDMLAAELRAWLTAIQTGGATAVAVGDAVEALRVALEVERIGLAQATSHLTVDSVLP